MSRRAAPKIAAFVLGLAIAVSLADAQPAHAGISVPLPPPSITQPPPPPPDQLKPRLHEVVAQLGLTLSR